MYRRSILFLTLYLFIFLSQAQVNYWGNRNIRLGERLDYSIYYGWFKMGKMSILHDPEFHWIDDEPHYNVQFLISTAGWFKFFTDVKLCVESYINAKTFRSNHSTMLITTRKKVKKRLDKFTYTDSIEVHTFHEHNGVQKTKNYVNPNMFFSEPLAVYLYLRDQVHLVEREEKVNVFVDDKQYEFAIQPKSTSKKELGEKVYLLKFPMIEDFPKDKESYVIIADDKWNTPAKFKVFTNKGKFTLIQED